MNGWMDGWFLSICAEDALVVVVVVGPKNSPRAISIFRPTTSVTTSATPSATSAACQVKSVHLISATCLKLYSGVFSTNVTKKEKEKKRKHRQTVGTIVGVPGSFHTGVAMQHICTCTHGTTFFLLLLSSGHHQRVAAAS